LEEGGLPNILTILFAVYFLFLLFRRKKKRKRKSSSRKKVEIDSFTKGTLGETAILRELRRFEKSGAKVLANLYIPKANDEETTEVDAVLLHRKGFFVIEAKNYNGWIFGNEKNKYWTQTLAVGRGRSSHKQRFYNPLRQNGSHIAYLKKLLANTVPMFSIVVFTDNCVLKEITVAEDKPYKVINQSDLTNLIQQKIEQEETDLFTDEDIAWMYEELLSFANASDEIKQRHIQQLEARNNEHLY